ncbi:hypothetical protein CDAR_250361 [Caerostris darwini]|uniref:Uncharacterized protein n=1 Tax=Caerostris darwini TaxID=1538125 RepID=A0AAV4UM19_9ARAC|nr:hypothetical protein CDAR_250361 [Caerostris darwini]
MNLKLTLLTFERFCAGLRICLLCHDSNKRSQGQHSLPKSCPTSRPSSVPLPERGEGGISIRKPSTPLGKTARSSNSSERLTPVSLLTLVPSRSNRHTATVRPNNTQRALSMPQLQTEIKSVPKRDWGKREGPKRTREPMDKSKVSLALKSGR